MQFDHVLEYFWCSFHRDNVVDLGGTGRSVTSDHRHPLQCTGEVKPVEDLQTVAFALTRHHTVTYQTNNSDNLNLLTITKPDADVGWSRQCDM